MKCMMCGGDTELIGAATGEGYARCFKCGHLFARHGEAWAPLKAAHGGVGPDHAQAEALGFPKRETDNERAAREDPGIARRFEVGGRGINDGIPLKADRHGISLDRERLANKIEQKIDQKIAQTITGLWMGALIFILLLGGFAWGAWFIYSKVMESMDERGKDAPAKVKRDAELSSWDGETPFNCAGVDEVEIKGVKAKLEGETAITVAANCELKLTNCDIEGEVAIHAKANGSVTIKGGSLTGAKAAILAEGNSHVEGKGVKVTGPEKKTGHGVIAVK